MAQQISIQIDGLEEALAKLTPERANGPMGRFLDRGAIYIQSQARSNAPVDTGRLRNSIGVESPTARTRIVGANTAYAEYVETGTRPHWPPPSALAGWARRHGTDPFLVARAIARAGTKPQPYMKPAAEAGETFIKSLIPTLAAEIEAAYRGGG